MQAALMIGCIQGDQRAGNTTTTTDATSAGDSRDATVAEPDTTGCSGCLIDQSRESCVAAGTTNPANVCEVCDPGRDAAGWVPVAGEVACEDNDECTTTGVCFEGGCVAPLVSGCGELPPCATAIACDGEACEYVLIEDTCLIDGTCFEDGAHDPENPCFACDADVQPRAWSFADGEPCDDEDACTYEDHCEEGVCAGTENDCTDPYECTLDFCDGGSCVNQVEGDMCLVLDQCREEGEAHPDDACRVCAPEASQTEFTVAGGGDCDDGDVCTTDDRCSSSGACRGELEVLGHEPNEEPAQAQLVGQGVTTFPAGSTRANLNPLSDKDFFSWSMPLVGLDGLRRPTVRVTNFGEQTMRVCVYASCGATTSSLVAPIVTCDGRDNEAVGPLKGCCADIGADSSDTVAVEATCVEGGTVQQGFGYASVRVDANVADNEDPQCGEYLFEWGAALK